MSVAVSNRIDAAHRWRVLSGITIVQLFSVMSGTVVTTAAPHIAVELQGFSLYGLIFAGYTLAAAVTTPIVGGLSDVIGRRPFYIAGLVVFVVGSLLCAVAGSMWVLVAGRVLSGLGGGPLIFLVSTTVGDLFPVRQRGAWISLNMAVFGIGSIVGPVVGGVVTDSVGWRWLFWANLPLAVLALGMLAPVLPRLARPSRLELDIAGILLLTVAVTGVLASLTRFAIDFDWSSWPTVGAFVAGIAALGALVWRESRAPSAVIPLHLFRSRAFVQALGINFLMGMVFFAALVFIPLDLEAGAGKSAAEAGVLLAPFLFLYAVGGVTSGQIVSRTGRFRTLGVLGILAAGAGCALLAVGISPVDQAAFALAIGLIGLGCSISFAVLILVVQNAFAYRLLGTANSIRILGINVAQALGIPALLVLTLVVLRGTLAARLTPDQAAAASAVFERNPQAAAAGAAGLPDIAAEALRAGLSGGVRASFLALAAVSVLAFLVSLFLPSTALAERLDEDEPRIPAERAGAGLAPVR
jgi:multidrug resistance protein